MPPIPSHLSYTRSVRLYHLWINADKFLPHAKKLWWLNHLSGSFNESLSSGLLHRIEGRHILTPCVDKMEGCECRVCSMLSFQGFNSFLDDSSALCTTTILCEVKYVIVHCIRGLDSSIIHPLQDLNVFPPISKRQEILQQD